MPMTNILAATMDRLAVRLRDLPEDAQTEVLAEIEAKMDDLAQSKMTEEQRDLVLRRIAAPRDYASPAEVAALLDRYRPTP